MNILEAGKPAAESEESRRVRINRSRTSHLSPPNRKYLRGREMFHRAEHEDLESGFLKEKYQSQMKKHVKTRIIGFECFLSWIHKDHGLN